MEIRLSWMVEEWWHLRNKGNDECKVLEDCDEISDEFSTIPRKQGVKRRYHCSKLVAIFSEELSHFMFIRRIRRPRFLYRCRQWSGENHPRRPLATSKRLPILITGPHMLFSPLNSIVEWPFDRSPRSAVFEILV